MAENEPYKNLTEPQTNTPRRQFTWLVVGGIGVITILLGAFLLYRLFGDQGQKVPRAAAPLPPTATRAPGEAEVAVVRETFASTSTPTPAPTATVTPTPLGSTPVAVEPAEGWAFEGVRVQPDPGLGGLLIYGEAINNTDTSQRILGLQGIFYDVQGEPITPQETSDYWPIETVPPGWRMPFELMLIGPSEVNRIELQVVTEQSDQPLRTDFEVSELTGADADTEFCVTGRARNLGQPLDRFLMAAAVLYDADGRVINWGIGYQRAPDDLTGGNTVIVSACAQRYNHNVARYELRVWGK